jgi:hypothetical protein
MIRQLTGFTRTSSVRRNAALAVLVVVVAAFLLEVALVIHLQVLTFHPLPWVDEWDVISNFSKMEAAPGTGLGFWFFPHNEHRMAVGRIVTWLDFRVASGTTVLSLVAIVVAQMATVAAIGSSARKDVAYPLLFAACIGSALFSGYQMTNFLWAIQTQVAFLYLFAVVSVWSAAAAVEANGSVWRIMAACVFAASATFCQAGGLFVFGALFALALRHHRRVGRRALATILIAGTLVALFYWFGPGGRPRSLPPSHVMVDQVVWFAIAFLGSPFAGFAPALAIPAGAVSVILSAVCLWHFLRDDRSSTRRLTGHGLILLMLAIAISGSISRAQLGVEAAVESRYATPALMLYVGIMLSLWPNRVIGAGRRVFAATGLIAIVIAAYGVVSHWFLQYNYLPLPEIKSNAETAFVAGVKDESRLKPVGPADHVMAQRPYLLRHGLSVFLSASARSLDHRLTEVFSLAPGECTGHFDTDVETIPGQGYRLSGWAITPEGGAFTEVVLVDNEVVRGIGRFVVDRPDVIAAVKEAKHLRVGFAGYVRPSQGPVRAYVLTHNKTAACLLDGEVKLPR